MENNSPDILDDLIKTADAKKATDIRRYHITGKRLLVDNVVIVSTQNRIHCKAVLDELSKRAKEIINQSTDQTDSTRVIVSGNADSEWVILDLGNDVFHVMSETMRQYYQLDSLFEEKAVVYHH